MAETILFTGFPGFIGMRLLPRILELKPHTRIECLVQEKFLGAARQAVATLEGKLGHPRGRIGLVVGDITVRGLGIEGRRAKELRGLLKEAYHLAAVYDLTVSREVGRRINVEGTKNVLEFKFDGPYFVLRAMERLPSHGLFARLGSGLGTVNVVPVDFVVEALARLSAVPESLGKTYHLTDPKPHSAVEIAQMFAGAIGKKFVYVPVPIAMAKAFFTPRPVQSFFGLPPEALDYFDDPVRHDATQATRELAALGIECPSLADYVPKLVAFYRQHKHTVRRSAMI